MSTNSNDGSVDARVRVESLRKVFHNARRDGAGATEAVAGVSFSIRPGEIYGLVGGSGAGKTTIARLILRLLPATSGRVWVDGRDILAMRSRQLRRLRQQVQMVAQDPYQALHPAFPVRDLVAEPLVIHRIGTRTEREQRVAQALDDVALSPAATFMDRFAHNLSGGQRQRVAIARAIVLRPTLLVADEPTSMLDASVQMGILNVLCHLRDTCGLSALVITHDLAVARHVCDRVGVMRAGQMVEEGPVEHLIANPGHEYTKALLEGSGS